MEDFSLAADVAIDLLNIEVAVEAYLYIGRIYIVFGQQEQADEVLNLGYKLAKGIGSARLIAKSAIFLSDQLLEQQRYQEALAIIHQSEASLLELGDLTWLIESGKTQAICYQKTQHPEEAELYFASMFAIAQHMKIKWGGALIAIHYAQFLLEWNEWQRALEMLDWADPLLKSFDDLYLAQLSAELRFNAYKKNNDFKMALESLMQFEKIKLKWVQLNVSEDESRKKDRFKNLQKVMKNVDRTRNEFERLLEPVISRASIGSEKLLLEKCKELADECSILWLEAETKLKYRRVVENKIDGLLRDFCLHGDIWLRTLHGQYLIYFTEGAARKEMLQLDLLQTIDRFPWQWHDCEVPVLKTKWMAPRDVIMHLHH
ncbi:hypothetical protein [Chitinibacter sp. S2-10]|uniref:hypothetical protein n=1 Tax=Chitinibacter sp. S2-10 TaxID=3373597 RepID=UPI003977A6D5